MKAKTALRKAQEIAKANREYARKNPYRCETCKHWVGKKCAKFPQIHGIGKDHALLEDGSESCGNGWEGHDGSRAPDYLEVAPTKRNPEAPPKDDFITVYVVLAKRWGCDERHSYVVGVGATPENAKEIAENEEANRGGKYSCDILRTALNRIPKDTDELPWAWVKARQTQPEPMEAEYLCKKNYKCLHIAKRRKEVKP